MVQSVTLETLKSHLKGCGYAPALLVPRFRFGPGSEVPLAAFAHEPVDARSACIAVARRNGDGAALVASYRDMGAPVVFLYGHDAVEWWRQGVGPPARLETIPASDVASFFRKRRQHFAPEKVFRAKTLAHLEKSYQLDFVDLGLMPLVEGNIGQKLSELLERVVSQIKRTLWPNQITPQQGQWILKSAFWLLAAKILADKKVSGFPSLDLLDVRKVFRCLEQHYGAQEELTLHSRDERDALVDAARILRDFASLGHVTTESLVYVYENTLISKETRSELGTHSTPSYLVDYMLWQLVRWIEAIPEAERSVFEPACGHAAFLVSAMRLLRDLASPGTGRRQAFHRYLQGRLHGSDVDGFALEIARLSLTLADVPNPDGWDLQQVDLFEPEVLEKQASDATILLTNPPFQNFSAQERSRYRAGCANKAAELLARVLPQLRPGSVFGIVVPQSLLTSPKTAHLREMMLRDFEIAEVCLFPDNTFAFSGAESAILVGRKTTGRRPNRGSVRFRRVRKHDMEAFKRSYSVTSEDHVPQVRFLHHRESHMYVPELIEVWEACRDYPLLQQVAEIQKGLDFVNRDTLASMNASPWSETHFEGAVPGFVGLKPDLQIHERPAQVWVNLQEEVIRAPGSGTTTGRGQVILNYARVSRGPWRLKAFIDPEGHAVTSRFITVRPRTPVCSLEYLWALCNSPLANAYVYAHTEKRDILVSFMRRMRVPVVSAGGIEAVTTAARVYLRAVSLSLGIGNTGMGQSQARHLLLQMDAEILRLYDLPPRLERQLLDVFAGEHRVGVPFSMDRYFPEGYEPCFSLHDYLSDAYRRSTAAELRARHEAVTSSALLGALDRAVRDFEDSP